MLPLILAGDNCNTAASWFWRIDNDLGTSVRRIWPSEIDLSRFAIILPRQ